MPKRLVVAASVLFWGAVAAAGCEMSSSPVRVSSVADAPAARAIDLNKSGVLEMLQGSHPAHSMKIRKILEGILQQQDADVPRWIQTNFNGRDVTYVPIVLTTHPPKRRLSFTLDAMRYEAIIVLKNVRGEIHPAG